MIYFGNLFVCFFKANSPWVLIMTQSQPCCAMPTSLSAPWSFRIPSLSPQFFHAFSHHFRDNSNIKLSGILFSDWGKKKVTDFFIIVSHILQPSCSIYLFVYLCIYLFAIITCCISVPMEGRKYSETFTWLFP